MKAPRVTYRAEDHAGLWLLFRKVEPCACCPGSERRVGLAGYPDRAAVFRAATLQRKADVRAAERLGLEVEVRILPYP